MTIQVGNVRYSYQILFIIFAQQYLICQLNMQKYIYVQMYIQIIERQNIIFHNEYHYNQQKILKTNQTPRQIMQQAEKSPINPTEQQQSISISLIQELLKRRKYQTNQILEDMQERYTTLRELSLVYLYPKEVDRGNFEDMGGCYRADELERKLGMIGDSYEWENKHRITVQQAIQFYKEVPRRDRRQQKQREIQREQKMQDMDSQHIDAINKKYVQEKQYKQKQKDAYMNLLPSKSQNNKNRLTNLINRCQKLKHQIYHIKQASSKYTQPNYALLHRQQNKIAQQYRDNRILMSNLIKSIKNKLAEFRHKNSLFLMDVARNRDHIVRDSYCHYEQLCQQFDSCSSFQSDVQDVDERMQKLQRQSLKLLVQFYQYMHKSKIQRQSKFPSMQ